MAQETMLEYVKRKINDKAYNSSEMARRTGMRKATISEIGSGKIADPQHSTVEKLFNYFKGLSE